MNVKLKRVILQVGTLVCRSCGKTKSVDDFYINLRLKNGRHKDCKTCNKIKKLLA